MTKFNLIRLSRLPVARSIQCTRSFALSASDALGTPPAPVEAERRQAPPHTETQPREILYQRRLTDLKDSLERTGNPNKVWNYYINLVNILGYEKQLPVELHQEVLRKCTPSTEELHSAGIRRIMAKRVPIDPHTHEGRFQAVIRNIRGMGALPTLADYNFILEQFAAVAHHEGAMHVYHEMIRFGVQPRTKTYGLCLRAIATRLAIPAGPRGKEAENRTELLIFDTRKMVATLMDDMRKYAVRMTSVNLDLIVRVLKFSSDFKGFDTLMKVGYGIDLSNPDRAPFEADAAEQSVESLEPQPFSTAALNTTVDMLGRLGMISKMVQAFEVLTEPLPPSANEHFSVSFEDDEDFGVSAAPAPRHYVSPYAPPNTTTYNILISWLAVAGHHNLARHYAIQLMKADQAEDKWLREQLLLTPINRIPAPHIAINARSLRGVYAVANHDKNPGLMRWVWRKCFTAIRRKTYALSTFRAYAEKLANPLPESEKRISPIQGAYGSQGAFRNHLIRWDPRWRPPVDPIPPSEEEPGAVDASTSSVTLPIDSPPAPASVEPAVELVESRTSEESTPSAVSTISPQLTALADLNVNFNELATPPPPPVKYLDLNLHMDILTRDVRQIQLLQQECDRGVERVRQRKKETLGRRVWNGKNVYLRSEEARVVVQRRSWTRVVNFAPLTGLGEKYLEAERAMQRQRPRLERRRPQLMQSYHERNAPIQPESIAGVRSFATGGSDASRKWADLSQPPPPSLNIHHKSPLGLFLVHFKQ